MDTITREIQSIPFNLLKIYYYNILDKMPKPIMSKAAFDRMVQIDTANIYGNDQVQERERLNLIVNGNPYHLPEPERIKMLQNPKVAKRIILGKNYGGEQVPVNREGQPAGIAALLNGLRVALQRQGL